MTNPHTSGQLESQDWPKIMRKFTAATIVELKRHRIKLKGGRLPDGTDPADLAQDIVLKVLTGQRTWNPVKHPDLLKFLIWNVLQSEISNLAKKLHRASNSGSAVVYTEASIEAASNPGEDDTVSILDRSYTASCEKALIDRETIEHLRQLLPQGQLQQVFDWWYLDYENGEIAKEMDMTAGYIAAQKKRIQRMFRKFPT